MKKKHRKTRGGRKPRISPVVMARDFLGMAIEEIRVARTEESIGTEDGNVYARNKAFQSAGMGVELVYKALILGQGRTPIGSGQKGHRIEVLHGQLSGTDKEALEKRIRDVGWSTASYWCRYLDDTVRHAQRKYLMYDTQRQRQGISFPTHGPASVAGMVRVFEKAFELADRRVRSHLVSADRTRRKHRPGFPSCRMASRLAPSSPRSTFPKDTRAQENPWAAYHWTHAPEKFESWAPRRWRRNGMPSRIQPETSLTPRTRRQYSHGYAQRTDRRDRRHPGVPSCPFGPDSLKPA